jgi:uncharacterized protein with FMN-binding domain
MTWLLKQPIMRSMKDRTEIDILIAGSGHSGAENTDHEMLYERVIESQPVEIATISDGTLTTKAYLQCVENALV